MITRSKAKSPLAPQEAQKTRKSKQQSHEEEPLISNYKLRPRVDPQQKSFRNDVADDIEDELSARIVQQPQYDLRKRREAQPLLESRERREAQSLLESREAQPQQLKPRERRGAQPLLESRGAQPQQLEPREREAQPLLERRGEAQQSRDSGYREREAQRNEQGVRIESLDISPYHVARANGRSVSQSANLFLQALPLEFNPISNRKSLPFSVLADALDALSDAKTKALQSEILRVLFSMTKAAADPENVGLEMYLLLKMLMPKEDNESVYGMKTTRLLKVFGQALSKKGKPEVKPLMLKWLSSPQAQTSIMARGRGIVCLPELIVASHCSRIPAMSEKQAPVTLQDIACLCQTLTKIYLTQGTQVPGAETSQVEAILPVLGRLSFKEWALLNRIILKSVPVGIGPAAVLSNVALNGQVYFSKHRDLALLANYAVEGGGGREEDFSLTWGVPFIPMTCERMKSPYLFRWLFSKEDALRKPITPVNGRLIIHSNTNWYVPVNSKLNSAFVSVENERAILMKSRRRHILLMREFRKSRLLDESNSRGVVLHYTLSSESNNVIIMLLKAVSDATTQSIEFVEDDLDLDLRDGHMQADLSNEENAQVLLDSIVRDGSYTSGKNKLKVTVAFTTKKKKTKPKKPTMYRPPPNATKSVGKQIAASFSKAFLRDRLPTRVLRSSSTKANDDDDDQSQEPDESVIVQLKYDGDRIQAHFRVKDGGGIEAKLFTKWGKDVSEMYSNVRDDLQNLEQLVRHAPCILDGELIVVDEAGNPMPWSSEKWKHNVEGKKALPLNELVGPLSDVVTLVYDGYEEGQGTINNGEDSYDNDRLTFATIKGIGNWNGLGPTDKKQLRGRVIHGGRLRLIVFDILMHAGIMVHSLPCRKRLNLLRNELKNICKNMTHVRVIEESYNVTKVSDIIEKMKDVVKNKQEGLIAKDETKPYTFGRTKSAQKIKLSGPDINVCVVGVGFTLSANPRFCGILTAVEWENEGGERLLVSYCRTESLEGDNNWKASEHIMSLPSKVNIADLERAMKTQSTVQLERYIVKMTQLSQADGNFRVVEWKAKLQQHSHFNCKLVLLNRGCIDIQWLCSPHECAFGLSIKGDLRPVDSDEYGQKPIWHPRHPVGRIEFVGHQMSKCDTNETVRKKFEDAQVPETCIEDFTFRRINRMRAMPPTIPILEEIRKVVSTLQDLQGNEEEVDWPKPPPVGFCTPDGFSQMLEDVSKYKTVSPKTKMEQQSALKRLTPEERQTLVGLPVFSQWKNMKEISEIPPPEEVSDAFSKAEQNSEINDLIKKFSNYSSLAQARPVMRKISNSVARVAADIGGGLLSFTGASNALLLTSYGCFDDECRCDYEYEGFDEDDYEYDTQEEDEVN